MANQQLQTVSDFKALSDSDSRLAVELAVKLRPVSELLSTYNLSRADLVRKLKDSMFRDMVKQAKALWESDLSVKERIRLKSQILVEDSVLEVFQILHNKENAIPARLDAFKQLARVAEVDTPTKTGGGEGSRFTVSINLGDTIKPVVIEGETNGQSTETA
jgi:hypothetical protein